MYNSYNFESSTLEKLLDNFKDYLNAEKISKGSVRSYLSDIRHFFGWLNGFVTSCQLPVTSKFTDSDNQSPITDHLNLVNEKVLEAYKKYQVDNHVPTSTINRRFSSLRRFGNFLNEKRGYSTRFDTLRNIPEEEKPFPEDRYHLEEFRVWLWKNRASKSTIKNYINDIRQFLLWQEK